LSAESLLRAIGISRQESAIEFLLDIVRRGRVQEAVAALESLQLVRGTLEIRSRIADAVAARHENEIRACFKKHFAESPTC
jgi:hypothetical protein